MSNGYRIISNCTEGALLLFNAVHNTLFAALYWSVNVKREIRSPINNTEFYFRAKHSEESEVLERVMHLFFFVSFTSMIARRLSEAR